MTTRSSASSAPRSRVSPRPPARSSRRLACPPSPRRPPTRAVDQRLGHLPPRPRQRRHRRARRPPSTSATCSSARRSFVVDDASEYGKGLADIVKRRLGAAVVGDRHDPDRQTDFSATVTKIRSSGADAVFFGGYYAEAGLLVQADARRAASKATFVVGDGVKDDGFIRPPVPAAEGTIITCPCLPPDKAGGTFFSRLQGGLRRDPGHLLGRGLRRGQRSCSRASRPATATASRHARLRQALRRAGRHQAAEVRRQGRAGQTCTVWAYKVEGGKIVPDQEIK